MFIGDMAALLSGKIPLVLTYHAEIMKRKGLYYLLDAIKALSEVKLCIVGEKGDFTDERIISVSIQFYPLIFSESLKESYVKSF